MFEELERFPIKAGFSQQASCQICFSIISFNWDPRFCETYTCDLKIKILKQVAVFLRQIWDQLGAVAGSFHLLGIFGICFPPPPGRLLSFGIRVTDRSQCWLRAIICQPGDHLPSVWGKRGRHFRDHLPSARHFREHLLGIARPRRPLGILHGIRDKGGIREIIGQELEDNTFTICILRMIRFNIRILLCWQWFSQNIVKIFWEIL